MSNHSSSTSRSRALAAKSAQRGISAAIRHAPATDGPAPQQPLPPEASNGGVGWFSVVPNLPGLRCPLNRHPLNGHSSLVVIWSCYFRLVFLPPRSPIGGRSLVGYVERICTAAATWGANIAKGRSKFALQKALRGFQEGGDRNQLPFDDRGQRAPAKEARRRARSAQSPQFG
jgi:hypothetical protein